MRKSILRYFLAILTTALVLCSLFFYFIVEEIVLTMAKEDMLTLVETIDATLTMNENIDSLEALEPVLSDNEVRLTLIDLEGTVLFDSGMEESEADNHINREEVKVALNDGYSYSKRYSSSLNTQMLYLAYYNEPLALIERVSIPLSELNEYQGMLVPWVILGAIALMMISYALAKHFSASISDPLNEIAEEMKKLENQDYGLNFKNYAYPELQMITTTTSSLAKNLESHLLQLEREKRIRQTFFANASHELKTPLTSIKGYTELLDSDLLNDEVTRKDAIQRLKKETKSMSNLINDILMVSRLEAKDAMVVREEIHISQFLKETTNYFKSLSKQYDVSLHCKCNKKIIVEMALTHLRGLVDNLLTNAIKYNKPKGKVFIDAYVDGNNFILEVEDTGIGIPKKHQSHVFERFYRIDKGRSKKMGGTGLGLAIVKHIVQYYNGTIQLVSEENKGTKITVVLPVIKRRND